MLIPCLDLFNHSRQSRVTWALNGHAEKGELVTFTLHNAVRAGEQVFNSYGPKSNEDLLASYGFVDEGMHDDAVTLKLGGGQLQIAPDEDRAKVDQHYWRYGEACPTSLLSQVEELLRCQDDVEQEASHAQADLAPENRAGLDSLMRKGEALEMIVELLQRKREGFLSSQRAFEKLFACADGADAEEMVAIRPSVAQNVQIYRKGEQILFVLSAALEINTDLTRCLSRSRSGTHSSMGSESGGRRGERRCRPDRGSIREGLGVRLYLSWRKKITLQREPSNDHRPRRRIHFDEIGWLLV